MTILVFFFCRVFVMNLFFILSKANFCFPIKTIVAVASFSKEFSTTLKTN